MALKRLELVRNENSWTYSRSKESETLNEAWLSVFSTGLPDDSDTHGYNF